MSLAQFGGYGGPLAQGMIAAPVTQAYVETIDNFLLAIVTMKGWTEPEKIAGHLASLRNSQGIQFFSLYNKPFIYEVISMLGTYGTEITYDHLLQTDGSDEYYFRSPSVRVAAEKISRELFIAMEPMKGNLTLGECINAKCQGKHLDHWSLQTRGLDEPETDFYKCLKCGTRWQR